MGKGAALAGVCVCGCVWRVAEMPHQAAGLSRTDHTGGRAALMQPPYSGHGLADSAGPTPAELATDLDLEIEVTEHKQMAAVPLVLVACVVLIWHCKVTDNCVLTAGALQVLLHLMRWSLSTVVRNTHIYIVDPLLCDPSFVQPFPVVRWSNTTIRSHIKV